MICFFVDIGNIIIMLVSYYMLFFGIVFDFFFNLLRLILGVFVVGCLKRF